MRKVGCPFPRASSKEWGLDGLRMETAKNKQINKQSNREKATAQLLQLAIFKSIGSYAQFQARHTILCVLDRTQSPTSSLLQFPSPPKALQSPVSVLQIPWPSSSVTLSMPPLPLDANFWNSLVLSQYPSSFSMFSSNASFYARHVQNPISGHAIPLRSRLKM